jgi:hypothetical protein
MYDVRKLLIHESNSLLEKVLFAVEHSPSSPEFCKQPLKKVNLAIANSNQDEYFPIHKLIQVYHTADHIKYLFDQLFYSDFQYCYSSDITTLIREKYGSFRLSKLQEVDYGGILTKAVRSNRDDLVQKILAENTASLKRLAYNYAFFKALKCVFHESYHHNFTIHRHIASSPIFFEKKCFIEYLKKKLDYSIQITQQFYRDKNEIYEPLLEAIGIYLSALEPTLSLSWLRCQEKAQNNPPRLKAILHNSIQNKQGFSSIFSFFGTDSKNRYVSNPDVGKLIKNLVTNLFMKDSEKPYEYSASQTSNFW